MGEAQQEIDRHAQRIEARTLQSGVSIRHFEEFWYAEIGEMLAEPVGTVMSRISRGRRLLFEKLNTDPRGTRKGPKSKMGVAHV